MTEIVYKKGDATLPDGEGVKIICHIVNSLGKWGAGFVVPLGQRYPTAKQEYLKWFGDRNSFKLGEVQYVQIDANLWVANMLAQAGLRGMGSYSPIRYEALAKCLENVTKKAIELNASVCGPKFGSGLSGGSWDIVEKIIQDSLCRNDIPVTIYEL